MISEQPNRIKLAADLNQSIWVDELSRWMIRSGELARLVQLGVSGMTSNPANLHHTISRSDTYDSALMRYARAAADPVQIHEDIVVEDTRAAADVLHPVYSRTRGREGFVSLEVDPHLAYDTEGTVGEALRLFATIDRPNVMIKLPGTPEGIPAIRQLTSEGVNLNVTLLYSTTAYRAAANAYIDGLRDRVKRGEAIAEVASVASFPISSVDSTVDELLDQEAIHGGAIDLAAMRGLTGIANARLAYSEFVQMFTSDEYRALLVHGARKQRPLWCSTGVSDPAYPDTLYVDNLIGAETVNAMPVATLEAFLDHGLVRETVSHDVEAARSVVNEIEGLGVSLEAMADELLRQGVQASINSYDGLIETIGRRLTQLPAA